MTFDFLEKNKKIILALLFLLSVFLIVFQFTDTPKTWVDEGVFTEAARNLAMHGVMGLQTAPGVIYPLSVFLSTGYPVIAPVALSLKLFGIGIFQSRLPMLLFMCALVVLFYFFVKKRYGFYPAILSVLLLISFSPFYGNGRSVQGEVPGLAFLLLGLVCLQYLEESLFQNKKWALYSGLAFGLSAATKPLYVAVLSLSLCVSCIIMWKKIPEKKILWWGVGGFVVPLLAWVFTLFPTFDSFKKIVPTYLLLASNHGSSASIFQTILTNFLRFFTESTPILFSFLFVCIALSFVYRIWKKEDLHFGVSLSESIIFLFIVFNAATYLVGTGWYRYFFPATILLYLLFPASMLFLSEFFDKKICKKIVLALPIFLVIFQFYYLMFRSDTSFVVQRARNATLSAVLSAIPEDKTIFFDGTVEALVFFKGEKYSQYLNMGFLVAGDDTALASSTYDSVLTGDTPDIVFNTQCYTKKPVDRYFLYERIEGCKK